MIVEPVEERLLCHPDYLLIHGFSLRKTFHDQSNSFTMSLEGYATLIFAILPLVFTDSSIDRYISK